MRVIVTRAQRETKRWVGDLAARGFDALALPLIKVGSTDDKTAVARAWEHLNDYVGVMFVSANAVDYFFSLNPSSALEFNSPTKFKTRAWATGPGTARALLRAGVAPDQIDVPTPDVGQFDSEALWQIVGTQVRAGQRVLIVRGVDTGVTDQPLQGSGRDWFANRVTQVGAGAEFVVAYQRSAPELSAPELEMARLAASDGSVWLFSSAQAVANLDLRLPGQNWAQARALATHPRIAAAAQKTGFGVVYESRPTLSDVVTALQNRFCL